MSVWSFCVVLWIELEQLKGRTICVHVERIAGGRAGISRTVAMSLSIFWTQDCPGNWCHCKWIGSAQARRSPTVC